MRLCYESSIDKGWRYEFWFRGVVFHYLNSGGFAGNVAFFIRDIDLGHGIKYSFGLWDGLLRHYEIGINSFLDYLESFTGIWYNYSLDDFNSEEAFFCLLEQIYFYNNTFYYICIQLQLLNHQIIYILN